MPRLVEVTNKEFRLKDKKVATVLERIVTPFGNSAKVDVPKKHIGKRTYVVVMG